MYKPCPQGRRQAAVLASMNVRVVVGPLDLTYVATPPQRLAPVRSVASPRFQPRDEQGRFVAYAELWTHINLDFAMTAYSYDELDNSGGYLGIE